MNILINNIETEVADDSSLACVVEQFAAQGPFAVALNGRFVSKTNYCSTQVDADDQVEILSPIQGG